MKHCWDTTEESLFAENLASLLLGQKRIDEARSIVERARERPDASPSTWISSVQVALAAGEPKSALAQEGARREPGDEELKRIRFIPHASFELFDFERGLRFVPFSAVRRARFKRVRLTARVSIERRDGRADEGWMPLFTRWSETKPEILKSNMTVWVGVYGETPVPLDSTTSASRRGHAGHRPRSRTSGG